MGGMSNFQSVGKQKHLICRVEPSWGGLKPPMAVYCMICISPSFKYTMYFPAPYFADPLLIPTRDTSKIGKQDIDLTLHGHVGATVRAL